MLSLNPDRDGKTLILGVGNILCRDDGLGIMAAQMLKERELPSGVSVETINTPGWGLPNWLDGWSSVVLIDAVRMGKNPGEWRKFSPHEVKMITEDEILSLHQPGLAAGLALAEALDIWPEKLSLYGVEPVSTEIGEGLSLEVTETLLNLINIILDDLGKIK
ncbi:MAG: hydrogenase maturation protease [Anaerolineales bacterium]|nr:hydrogenase maturation protease [Anaerolineales bacterium]